MPRNARNPTLEQFWRRHLELQRLSGMTIRDYCRQHALRETSFYAWRRIIREGRSGSYSQSTVGSKESGDYSFDETATTDYSATQVVAYSLSEFTLVETGVDADTTRESGSKETGDYSQAENGVDGYTLSEWGTDTGGSLSESVTGTDTYNANQTGNHAEATYAGTTTGGGGWTRTTSGPGAVLASGSGVNTYTLTESGDALAGHFSKTRDGTDRYQLIDYFNDVSNNGADTTPGNITFHSHGLPFRDPEGGLEGWFKRQTGIEAPQIPATRRSSKMRLPR